MKEGNSMINNQTGELFQIVKKSNHYIIIRDAAGNDFLVTKCQISYDFTTI